MTRVDTIKRRADTILNDVLRSLFEEIDMAKLKREVKQLREAAPEFDPVQHADALAKRTAMRCAAAGAMTGLPAGLLAIATLGADLAYLIYQQFRLVLGIATIYGYEPSNRERISEAVTCMAYGSGVGLGKQGIAAMLESAAAETGVIGERIGARIVREGFGRAIPVVGAISGGMMNYFAVRAIGRATIRYYESQIDPGLAEEIWAEGDREHA
jgi:hypothetical protein